MGKIQILVEGKIDKEFIKMYCKHLSLNLTDVIIKDMGGWTKVKSELWEIKLRENTNSDNGINLIILDTDDDFAKRSKEIEVIKNEKGIEFFLFLVPNDKDLGAIEVLLLELTNKKYSAIFECFENYKNCLSALSPHYFPPNNKHKIYSYTATLLNTTSPGEIDFFNTEYWDLNNKSLDNLKKFLETHLSKI